MRRFSFLILTVAVTAAVLGGRTITAQDAAKYAVQVPDGLSLSEFQGYEAWEVVSVAHSATLNVIVGNPTAVNAYRAGIPGNGRPFPDGSKLVKIQWTPKTSAESPFPVSVPNALRHVAVMVKDSKKFADGGGWGYGLFDYVPASDRLTPNGTGASCGVACHTRVTAKDYVFTGFDKK